MSDFDTIARFALWTGLVSVGITALCSFMVIGLRARSILRDRKKNAFIDSWRGVLLQSIDRVPDTLPPIPAFMRTTFLKQWNYLQESLRGDARENLNTLLRRTQIDQYAIRLLNSTFMWRQLLGLRTIGFLQEHSKLTIVETLARVVHPVLSLAAIRTIIQLDQARGVTLLLDQLPHRKTWAPTKVAALLNEAGTETVCQRLADRIATGSEAERLALFPFAESTGCLEAIDAIRRIMRSAPNDRVAVKGLRLLNTLQDRETVIPYLKHAEWELRFEATRTLGRIATEQDVPLIESMLSDSEWRVRHVAAHALYATPWLMPEDLQVIRERQADEEARLILDQVRSEVTA